VAREVVADIVDNKLEPGSPLPPEAAMLREYGISRASLREALRILEVYGLISIKSGPNGGPRIDEVTASDFGATATFFFHVTGATFRELAEARTVIEPMMARLAAVRRPPDECALLRKLIEQSRGQEVASQAANAELSMEFHALIARMSGNQVLGLVACSFEEIFTMYGSTPMSQSENKAVLKVHERIAAAVLAGDADKAELLMRKHMEQFAEDFARRRPSDIDRTVDWL
jgi:DNA-binding FadR family transcriptional regulator